MLREKANLLSLIGRETLFQMRNWNCPDGDISDHANLNTKAQTCASSLLVGVHGWHCPPLEAADGCVVVHWVLVFFLSHSSVLQTTPGRSQVRPAGWGEETVLTWPPASHSKPTEGSSWDFVKPSSRFYGNTNAWEHFWRKPSKYRLFSTDPGLGITLKLIKQHASSLSAAHPADCLGRCLKCIQTSSPSHALPVVPWKHPRIPHSNRLLPS